MKVYSIQKGDHYVMAVYINVVSLRDSVHEICPSNEGDFWEFIVYIGKFLMKMREISNCGLKCGIFWSKLETEIREISRIHECRSKTHSAIASSLSQGKNIIAQQASREPNLDTSSTDMAQSSSELCLSSDYSVTGESRLPTDLLLHCLTIVVFTNYWIY